MKKLNRWIACCLAAVMCVLCLTACSGKTAQDGDKKLKIVTTIFPEYDWVKAILGDEIENVELTMLLDNGVDLHSYQPTAEDIRKISECDLFIYVGGESDAWVEDALKESLNENQRVINLMEVMGENAKEEEVVEGMQAEEEHEETHSGEDADEAHTGEDAEEEEVEYDEHVWLSLRNAELECQEIEKQLSALDPENQQVYEENLNTYLAKLKELDGKYQDAVNNSTMHTLLFADRFPFRYMVDDYGLDYYAAFVGCSAETEASFETITFLAGKIDELGLHTVLTIEKSDQKIARTVIENTKNKDQQILAMDSMQSTTSEDVKNGTTYLSTMESNLEILKQALK